MCHNAQPRNAVLVDKFQPHCNVCWCTHQLHLHLCPSKPCHRRSNGLYLSQVSPCTPWSGIRVSAVTHSRALDDCVHTDAITRNVLISPNPSSGCVIRPVPGLRLCELHSSIFYVSLLECSDKTSAQPASSLRQKCFFIAQYFPFKVQEGIPPVYQVLPVLLVRGLRVQRKDA